MSNIQSCTSFWFWTMPYFSTTVVFFFLWKSHTRLKKENVIESEVLLLSKYILLNSESWDEALYNWFSNTQNWSITTYWKIHWDINYNEMTSFHWKKSWNIVKSYIFYIFYIFSFFTEKKSPICKDYVCFYVVCFFSKISIKNCFQEPSSFIWPGLRAKSLPIHNYIFK